MADKLDKIPLDQLSAALLKALRQLDGTLRSTQMLANRLNDDVAPEARATLQSARDAMQSAQAVLSEQSPLQGDLHDALKQLSRASRALADLSDQLERHPESVVWGKGKNNDASDLQEKH
jgi:paraquat-inducible protein B